MLHSYLTRGRSSELAAPTQQQLPHPASTFALYVNTAALLWLFGFMLIEVSRSWRLPCDAHLHAFVLGAAILGVTLALVDFIAEKMTARAVENATQRLLLGLNRRA